MYEKGWVKVFNIDGADILVTQEFDDNKKNSKSIIKVEARSGATVDAMSMDCQTTTACNDYFSLLTDQNIREILHVMKQDIGG